MTSSGSLVSQAKQQLIFNSCSKHLWNKKDEMHMETFFVEFRLVEKELIYWSKINYSLITLCSNVLITSRSHM